MRKLDKQITFYFYLVLGTVLCCLILNYLFTIYSDGIPIFRGLQVEDSEVVPLPIRKFMSGERFILPQNDKRIINYIWKHRHLEPPSEAEYNLDYPEDDPSRGQGQFIQRILGNMTNGFFVEAGALDGETRSNTLFMEQHLGWKGLLIEGDPSNYELVTKKNRKAWTSNTCLAIKPYPHHAEFLQDFNMGKIVDGAAEVDRPDKTVVTVQCMPLFSLLYALNVTTVDYFSLDVEGNELQVLKTIPFEKVFIKTLSVEYIHTAEGKDSLLDFMLSKGYKKVGEVHYANSWANDFMFVHKNVDINY